MFANKKPKIINEPGPKHTERGVGRTLTEKEWQFVEYLAQGLSQTAAARHAGYKHPSTAAVEVLRRPDIKVALQARRAKFEAASAMSKKKVMDGLLEAIEQGKTLSDPLAQISGWREVAKLCGYYEPTKTRIEVSVNGQIVIQKLQQLSDAELLKLAEGNVIEGELVGTEDEALQLEASPE